MRERLLRGASGRVLEIGAGTGINLEHYPPAVEELVMAEPDPPMARKLAGKLGDGGRSARIVRAPAEALPFDDASFDTVVSTFVLCTVNDVDASVREMHRVLRPGGRLLFLEHVRSDDPGVARWQDRLRAPWHKLALGCNLNRRSLDSIEAGEFRVEELDRGSLPKAAPLWAPYVAGRAVPAG